jgi:tRNA pseudouridine55 synthase
MLKYSMDKIIVVNKPKGLTSHQAVAQYRKKLKTKKVGHAGTLDPFATGVLLILVGKATKRFEELLGLEKEYVLEITLGYKTETADTEGKIIKKATKKQLAKLNLNKPKIKKIIDSFKGEYIQTVPKYSAVKFKGKPLYKYARQNKKTPIPKRKVSIKDIKLLKTTKKPEPKLKIKVICSSGTYMRSLAEDIGEKLGMPATATALKRTRIGTYKLKT